MNWFTSTRQLRIKGEHWLMLITMISLQHKYLFPSTKEVFFILIKYLAIWINSFGPVTIKDMQTPTPLRSGHLVIQDAQLMSLKKWWKQNFISHRIAFGHLRHWRPKGAFWLPKNSTLFKNGQICRVGAYFLHKWFFLWLSFWDIVTFSKFYVKKTYVFFLCGKKMQKNIRCACFWSVLIQKR